MYLMRDILDMKFKQIGLIFGGKDHSTVMSAIQKVEKLSENDESLKQILRDLKAKIM